MSDLIQVQGGIARVEFDKVRKLKPTHGAISRAIAAASRDLNRSVSVSDLVGDVFVGQRYLLQALLFPALAPNENLSLDKVSELVDEFRKKGGKLGELQSAMVLILADYLGVETTKTPDEDDDPNVQPQPAGSDAGG